jgi:shikimate dehydrogenase
MHLVAYERIMETPKDRPTNFKQELVGVFGFPVAENPTQAMVEPALAAMGLDWRYLTVEVRPEGLGDAARGARAMNWKGFNCTIPHKVAVIPLLDRLDPAAEVIGAVNCVVHRDGELVGYNTDGKGFLQSLSAIRPPADLRAVILGAGARRVPSPSSSRWPGPRQSLL